jgi:benzoate-CoA ligase family protein
MSADLLLTDPVADDVAGAREIGFAIPPRYNASRILFDNLDNGNAERVAVRSPHGQFSYRQLARLAVRAGNTLIGLGLARGERVLLILNDTPAYPAFLFGAIRAGFVPVLTNTLTPSDLIRYYLSDSVARVVVIDADLVSQLTPEAIAGTALETVVVVNGAASPQMGPKQVYFDADGAHSADTLAACDTGRDDMAFWMYSSGSTGRPKGIVHLQHDMAYTAQSYARHILELTPDSICFSVPKIFFAYGMGNSLTFPFAAGASCVLYPGRPDPPAIFRTIAEYRPTVFFALPTVYTSLAKSSALAESDLTSLRLCVSAAEVLSNEVAAGWRAAGGPTIVEGLGSTEMLHIYLSNTREMQKPGAAGRRVPGYEIKLCDPNGREVGDDEEGILWVRGHSSAPLYWNRPDKTAETMRSDWLYTGDRFVRDRDGFYYFRGRADDLIKISGMWVYPLEVELCLADHPAVREVCVLAFELPDRRMTLKAFVVPAAAVADTAAFTVELQNYVKGKLLPYKYPRSIAFMTELPKTGTDKIDRQALAKCGPTAELAGG